MTIHKTLRIRHLLLPLLLVAGCDDPVSPLLDQGEDQLTKTQAGERARAPSFDGPDVVSFTVGSIQSVDYFSEHPDQEEIDVEVLLLPDGASYSVTDVAGNHMKRISVSWKPPAKAEGSLHVISLLSRTKYGGGESLAEFDIYVVGPQIGK